MKILAILLLVLGLIPVSMTIYSAFVQPDPDIKPTVPLWLPISLLILWAWSLVETITKKPFYGIVAAGLIWIVFIVSGIFLIVGRVPFN